MPIFRPRSFFPLLAFAVGMALSGSSAYARGVVVDDGLNPNLMRFNLAPLDGALCDSALCRVTLPYSVNIGGGFTNELFLYRSGIISVGKPLPAAAFSSAPVDVDGIAIDVPTYFSTAGHQILAPGFRPDDAGTPDSLIFSGQVTKDTTQRFASNSISFCTPNNSNSSFTTCPDGYDPNDFEADPAPFIGEFIALNSLDRFEGDINLRVGLQYVVFKKPANGFVSVEFFQDDNFFEETDPVFVGLATDIALFDLEDAKTRDFSYSFAVQQNNVPEPATWALMIGGFGILGTAARRRKLSAAYA